MKRGSGAPSTTKRAAIYYRVSGKGQIQGYSLDAQVRAIESWCRLNGWEIVARYAEPGRSAQR
jgi:DNA invertase Pin-like site-specific DNA recombinase